jgi:hypothetical protein
MLGNPRVFDLQGHHADMDASAIIQFHGRTNHLRCSLNSSTAKRKSPSYISILAVFCFRYFGTLNQNKHNIYKGHMLLVQYHISFAAFYASHCGLGWHRSQQRYRKLLYQQLIASLESVVDLTFFGWYKSTKNN